MGNSFIFASKLKSIIMNFPENLKYTKDHEWIKIDGDVATVGITDFAQRELGDIVFVDINTVGEELEADAVFGTVEAVKTVSDLFLPVAGKVLEVNEALNDSPESINNDPYGNGWMIRIQMSNAADADQLMDAKAYEATVN